MAEPAAEHEGAPLDVMLTDAALGPLRRWLPGAAGLRLVGSLARRPVAVGRRTTAAAAEIGRVAAGRSAVEPSAKDRRFKDPAWQNPLLHRVVQAYLVGAQASTGLLQDARLDWRSETRMRFLVDNAVAALAPSNSPVLNPTVVRAAIDSGGRTFLAGAANFARDMSSAPRVPSMVEADAFRVGRDLALTPGSVVLRTPVFELIHYRPSTPRVRTVPLLIAPPTINKFYVVDLAPGRSMVEHFVASGQQVFVMSWRNPTEEHAEWGLDTYAGAVLEALDAVERVCRVERTLLMGLCSGGIIASMVLGHLAATGRQDRVAGLVLGVTVLDQARAGLASAALDRRLAAGAAAASARRGYLDGRSLAELFAWLRPEDLVWNYWVNNYLLGRPPPAFDVLFWNSDTTRLPARLHRDFLELGMDNTLVTPGAASVLGTTVDLSAVTVDSYVIAGIADHICPWQSCHRSTQLLGGDSRFVLSTSGHIAALVNPPGNPKARYQVGGDPGDAAEWLRTARTEQGTWWSDAVAWMQERSGPDRPAPRTLGARGLPPLEPAPGTYVLET